MDAQAASTRRHLSPRLLAAAALLAAGPVLANVTFYSRDGFDGRSYTATRGASDLARYGLQDRASSAIVNGERWEVCEDPGFRGRCAILRPGQYPSLAAMGLNNQISSVRPIPRGQRVDDHRYAPPPVVVQDYRRRKGERLYEAPVLSARAVLGPPEQRCWVEREQVVRQDRNDANVGGAIAGAVIGGILGHQVGRGDTRDVATVGGAVAGAVIGSQVGGDGGRVVSTRPVQRCSTVPSQQPAYWDVVYEFRGMTHHVQLAQAPGRSVTVNSRGEPRAA